MSSIVRAISPEIPEPAPGTWSNCLVAAARGHAGNIGDTAGDEAVGPGAGGRLGNFGALRRGAARLE